MQTYELTRKLLSAGPTYEVRQADTGAFPMFALEKLRITADDPISAPLALRAAVAIDQRFFQE